MTTRSEGLRLLAVHAHPDDESSKGAATMARYVARGRRRAGRHLHRRRARLHPQPGAGRRPDDHRRPAARSAATRWSGRARSSASRHEWLGFVDSGLPEGDPLPPLPEGCFALEPLEEAAEPLVRMVREFRPHVITHVRRERRLPAPRPRQAHEVSVRGVRGGGRPRALPRHGEPWQPSKLYYHLTFHKARVVALHEAALGRGRRVARTPSGWRSGRTSPRTPERLTTRVPCGEYFAVRDAALLAHATQVDPHGRWFAVPLEVQQQVWPTEDFQLARSLVETDAPRGRPVRGRARDRRRRTVGPAVTVAAVLAARPARRRPASSTVVPGHARVLNDDTVSPGWLGLVVFLALGAATVLLLRSFRRHLAKVPPRFDDPPAPSKS